MMLALAMRPSKLRLYTKMTLYRDKYRVETTRLPAWDYSENGWYFVTVCTQQRECSLGSIDSGVFRPSPVGEIAGSHWQAIPSHYEDVSLDGFVLMPNHLHGIVVLGKRHRYSPGECQPRGRGLGAGAFCSPSPGSLGAIIRSYKAGVTKWCRENGYCDFAWQPRYYDHLIRNSKALETIRGYVWHNPLNWDKDKYFPHVET
jgi:putative transposase